MLVWFWIAVALASDVVIVLHPSDGLSTAVGSASLDSLCSSAVGPNFVAFVCTTSRNWASLQGYEVYSGSGRVGTFPSLTAPITEANGTAAPNGTVFTGCTNTGLLYTNQNCNDLSASGGGVTYSTGSTGTFVVSTTWMEDLITGCGTARFYCVSVDPLPAIWVSRYAIGSPISAIPDQICRDEDYGLPRTYALVCQPNKDWLPILTGQPSIFHRATGSDLGPSALQAPNFFLSSPILDGKGMSVNGSLYTGCDPMFRYVSAGVACQDWTDLFGNFQGLLADAGTLQNWPGNGAAAPTCYDIHNFLCVRLVGPVGPPAPTSSPTPFPTSAPTTTAPTTTAPTTTTPTTAPTPAQPAPTQMPTQPTPAQPSPAITPTTSTPSLAPSNAPSSAPSTVAPTMAPTPRPTAFVVVRNFTGNITQNVTVPGDGANVTVILPSSLFSYGNSTSTVVIGIGSLGDLVPIDLRGGDSVVSVDVMVDGEAVDVMDLAIPVEFVIPRPQTACAAQLAAPAKCVWWDTTALIWRTDNCSATPATLDDGSLATRCTCNHLTDFAVLLDRAAQCTQPFNESYLVFAGIYSLIALYCLVVVTRLQMLCDRATRFLRTQHFAIGAVVVVRLLSCLRFYGLLGEDLALEGVLTALPYLIELWIFTRLASTWLGLVEFTMLSSELRWEKIRPWLYGINIVGSLFVIALFVAFLVELNFTTALVGTIGIASVYVILAFGFLYYSSRLVTTMTPGSTIRSGNSSTTKRVGLCSPSTKIMLAGRVSAVCFLAQAVSSVLALVLDREFIAPFTMAFLAFNCLALIGLLSIYQGAVAKGFQAKSTKSALESSSQRSVEFTKASS